jgi:hypothetical protein
LFKGLLKDKVIKSDELLSKKRGSLIALWALINGVYLYLKKNPFVMLDLLIMYYLLYMFFKNLSLTLMLERKQEKNMFA